MKRMRLDLTLEEVVALKATVKLAQLAVGGYNVRAAPEREVLSAHLDDLLTLAKKANQLEEKREMMSHQGLAEGRKYLHVSIDEKVHEELHEYLVHVGGGSVRPGALGRFVEAALVHYLKEMAEQRRGKAA